MIGCVEVYWQFVVEVLWIIWWYCEVLVCDYGMCVCIKYDIVVGVCYCCVQYVIVVIYVYC